MAATAGQAGQGTRPRIAAEALEDFYRRAFSIERFGILAV